MAQTRYGLLPSYSGISVQSVFITLFISDLYQYKYSFMVSDVLDLVLVMENGEMDKDMWENADESNQVFQGKLVGAWTKLGPSGPVYMVQGARAGASWWHPSTLEKLICSCCWSADLVDVNYVICVISDYIQWCFSVQIVFSECPYGNYAMLQIVNLKVW